MPPQCLTLIFVASLVTVGCSSNADDQAGTEAGAPADAASADITVTGDATAAPDAASEADGPARTSTDAAGDAGNGRSTYPVYPAPSVATTGLAFYVSASTGDDGNAGTQAHPWRTLQHAASAITAGATGVTVHVLPGSYSGGVEVDLAGASFTAPVRFLSEVQWGAKLDGMGANPIWLMNGAYQEVVGFDVTSSTPSALGILYNASHVRVLENRVHDLASNACDSNGGAAIDTDSYSVTDAEVDNNVVFNIGPGSGTSLCSTVQGIYFATPQNKAYNNLCSSISGNGISSWHGATRLVLVNNTVVHTMDSGILIGCGDSACVLHDDSYVANNIVMGTGGFGIQEEGSTGKQNQYANNLVFGNKSGGLSLQNGLAGVGTLTADPMFANDTGTVATGDYHLKAVFPLAGCTAATCSPAIDTGTSMNTVPFDFDGYPRPYNGLFDVGAYEAHP
jgi:hypothetical protein